MKTTPMLAVVGLLLAGCSTAYHTYDGFKKDGYSETALAPDTYSVCFYGNQNTRLEKTQDLAMLRASEITLQHGYAFFSMSATNHIDVSTYTRAGYTTSTGGSTLVGNHLVMAPNATYTPPTTYDVKKPQSQLLIKLYNTQPTNVLTFDAAFLKSSLTAKYKIKQNGKP